MKKNTGQGKQPLAARGRQAAAAADTAAADTNMVVSGTANRQERQRRPSSKQRKLGES
jgi:hypothetical protein